MSRRVSWINALCIIGCTGVGAEPIDGGQRSDAVVIGRDARPIERDAGLLAKDTHGNTIRIAPPLIVTADEVDWACELFARILKD